MKRIALAILACSAIEAEAMMTPQAYRAAREAASHWLQLRVVSVKPPAALPGVCMVHADVLRTFRGAPPPAKTIEIEVECKNRAQRTPPGDEFRVDLEDLRPGRFAEAFCEVRGGRFHVVARQIGFVANPGDKPSFSGKE